MNKSAFHFLTKILLITSLLGSRVFADGGSDGKLSDDFLNRIRVTGLTNFNETTGLNIDSQDVKTFIQFNMEFSAKVNSLIGKDYPYEFELLEGYNKPTDPLTPLPFSNGNLTINLVANTDYAHADICNIGSPNALIGVTCHFDNAPPFEVQFWVPEVYKSLLAGTENSDEINVGVYYPGVPESYTEASRHDAMDIICYNGLAHEAEHAIPMRDERSAYIVQYLSMAYKYGLSYNDFLQFLNTPQYHPIWGAAPVNRGDILQMYPAYEFRQDIPIDIPSEENYKILRGEFEILVDKYEALTDGSTNFLESCLDTRID